MKFPVIDLQATGRNIKKLRRRNEFSVAELQDYFGFEYPNAIYKWQKGESLPTVDNLLALSVLFQVSMNEILVYEDQDFLIYRKVVFLCSFQLQVEIIQPQVHRLVEIP